MANEYGNTQDLVAVEEIRENTIVLKDGGLRQILMVTGVNIALKSESEQNVLTAAYQNLLNSVDFPLQIVVHSRKVNIEKYLAKLEAREREESSALLKDQIEEYKKYIRGFVQDYAIMEKIFFVVVPFTAVTLPTKESVTRFIPFLKKSKEDISKEAEQKQANFSENITQLSQRVNQVIEGLRSIGLDAIVLNDRLLVELFYNFYNPETIEKEDITLPAASA